MDEQQHRTVQTYRGRVEKLRNELDQLKNAVEEAASNHLLDKLKQTQQEYANYRLCEGLGADPVYLEETLITRTLQELIGRSKVTAGVGESTPMRVSAAACHALLLSNFSLADSLDFSQSSHPKLLSLLNEHSPLKNALRRWSAQIHDPFVKETVEQLRRMEKNFGHSVALLRKRIDTLRRRYEDERREEIDQMELERVENQTILRVSHPWNSLTAEFPKDVKEVYGIFHAIERQLEEIQALKELLNAELRKFMAHVILLYLAFTEQQSKNLRRTVLGSASPSAKLAEQLAREARQTDFLLPSEGLPVPHPKIPREFVALKKLPGYQNFKRTATIDQLQGADTVEFPTNR